MRTRAAVIHESGRAVAACFVAVEAQEKKQAALWLYERLRLMPFRWSNQIRADFERRGGLPVASACHWLLGVTEAGRGRLALSAKDAELREAAQRAAADGLGVAALAGVHGGEKLCGLLGDHCRRWGIEAAAVSGDDFGPAINRMLCPRWWLRRLRRAHGRRGEGAAIVGGVVRRGLWPYASQDAVERRQAQRRRNAAAMDKAVIENQDSGECLKLAEIVAGSVANPEIKRGELMTRIRGADEFAELQGWSCEFWTVTTPSRFHAQRILGATSEANPNYAKNEAGGDIEPSLVNPRAAARYLSAVWARARAAWKRRGLQISGLRTAEPHHDGCPHWHLIAYGPARDLRFARRLLRVYALRDSANEPGAKKHRFAYLKAKNGTMGAAYAAKYISKNINGAGLETERDGETGKKITSSVLRVDAWAAHWGIRQFQFFGMPAIGIWRALRKVDGSLAVVGSALEKARAAADEGCFRRFWQACAAGALALIMRDEGRLTQYGDKAAAVVAGVMEGGRRLLLPVRNWVIHWGGKASEKSAVLPFALSRSRVINCTGALLPDGMAGALASYG